MFLTVFSIVMASTAPVPPLLRVATKGPLFALGEARPAQPEPQVSQPITVPIYPSCAAYAALTSNTRTNIDFDNDTPTSKPRLMEPGLANKINNLADGPWPRKQDRQLSWRGRQLDPRGLQEGLVLRTHTPAHLIAHPCWDFVELPHRNREVGPGAD